MTAVREWREDAEAARRWRAALTCGSPQAGLTPCKQPASPASRSALHELPESVYDALPCLPLCAPYIYMS